MNKLITIIITLITTFTISTNVHAAKVTKISGTDVSHVVSKAGTTTDTTIYYHPTMKYTHTVSVTKTGTKTVKDIYDTYNTDTTLTNETSTSASGARTTTTIKRVGKTTTTTKVSVSAKGKVTTTTTVKTVK